MAHSTNLYKVNETFYFRVRIPKDLSRFFPIQDFKRSLRTKSLTSARRLITLWAAKTEKLFTTIRSGLLAGIMTGKQIKKLVEEYIGYTLREDDEERLNAGVHDTTVDTTEGPFQITSRAEYDPDMETIINELEQDKYDWVARRLNAFLEAKGISIEPDSYEYKALCRDIAHAHIDEIHQINIDRDMGNFSDKYYAGTEEGRTEPPEAAPDGLLLSELTAKYLAEKQARESCGQGTIDANKAILQPVP